MYTDKVLSTPHTLIAGTTGSGKSTALNEIINEILKKDPCDNTMILVDLKRVELSRYRAAPHTWHFETEPYNVLKVLDWANKMIDQRYESGKEYPDTYIIIDELADLVTIDGALERLTRIGRLGRAAKIHLICATQDPSRRTLKAQLMQNFTTAIALRCRSAIESRQIIGIPGAEELPLYGYGYLWDSTGVEEISINKVSDEEIQNRLENLEHEYKIMVWLKRFYRHSRLFKAITLIAIFTVIFYFLLK